ncbi:hypothetical protein N665_0328s0016 [Sinapis alba]|nr:hypothetical protein N665_0328s0016 [Sinapis alba]
MLVSASGIVRVSPCLPIRAFNRFDGYKISEPCDGLICLYTYSRIFNLVNPATTSRRRIPDPTPPYSFNGRHEVYTLLGIGRASSTVSPRYKIVWFFECDIKRVNKSTRCMVFALDSNTWRYVDPPHCRVKYRNSLLHLDGVMYCFADYMEEPKLFEQDVKLLSFDLHTETFQSISITPDIGRRYCHELISMCVLNHRICIFKSFVDDNDCFFKIWGLDIDKRSWETMYSIDLSCFPPEFKVGKRIIPMATINDYVVVSNFDRTIWVLYSSKSCILYHTPFVCHLVMSYFETLVSTYQ